MEMTDIYKLKHLLDDIQAKHGRYCTLTIRSSDEQPYQTYIADDNGLLNAHKFHDTYTEAFTRLYEFYQVEDVAAYDRQWLKRKVAEAAEDLDDARDEYEYLRNKLNKLEGK